MNKYRKIAKNNWQFTCKHCGFHHQSVDEFGAYEAEWRHRKDLACTFGQLIAPVREAMKVISDAFAPIVNAMNEADKAKPKYPTSINPNQNRRKK